MVDEGGGGGGKRRKSLAAGEARRDRFQHTRKGTGRVATERSIGLGSKVAGDTRRVDRDSQGFDNIDQAFAFSPAAGSNSEYELDVSQSSNDGSTRKSTKRGRARDVFIAPDTPNSDRANTPDSRYSDSEVADDSSEMGSPITPGYSVGNAIDTPMSAMTTASTPASSRVTGKLSFGGSLTSPDTDYGMDNFNDEGSPDRGGDSPSPPPARPATRSSPKKQTVQRASPKKVAKPTAPPAKKTQKAAKDKKKTKAAKPKPKSQPLSSADIDDVGDFEDEEVAPAPKTAKKKKQDKWMYIEEKTPVNPVDRERYANNTGGIIKQATASGLIEEIQQEDESGRRRSKRQKFKPLDHWRNERLIFNRVEDGVGTFLPTVNLAKPIASPSAFDDANRSKLNKLAGVKSRRVTKNLFEKEKKGAKKGRGKADTEEEVSSEEDEVTEAEGSSDEDDDEERESFNPVCQVRVGDGSSIDLQVVAKTTSMVQFEALNMARALGDPPVDPDRRPYGGKMFEEPAFSCGILRLPPGAKKQLEMTHQNEIFYVGKAAINCLEVKVHNSTYLLSKGDSFVIPPCNLYSLYNHSTNKPVEIFFLLAKHSFVNPVQR